MIDDKTNLKSNRSNLMLKVPPEQNKGESTKEETVPKTSNSAVLRQIQKKNIKLAKIRSQSNILDIENGQNEKIQELNTKLQNEIKEKDAIQQEKEEAVKEKYEVIKEKDAIVREKAMLQCEIEELDEINNKIE